MVKLAVVILAILFGVVASMMQPTLENMVPNVSVDYDSFSFTDSKKSHLRHYSIAGVYKSTGRNYSAFVAEFHPSSFSFFPPTADGCTKLVKPSESSYGTFKCDYATNGGFFTWDTTKPSLCIGNLVSEGRVWQLPTDGSGSNRANFGITFDNKLVTGFVGLDSAVLSQFKSLITGWGWLVRNGKGNVETSADLSVTSSFTTIKAPRTAVGHYKNGTMILLEVDGEGVIYTYDTT